MIDLAVTATHIRTALLDYVDRYPDEKPGLAGIVDLIDAGAELTSRKEFRGHATAGAVLLGPDGRVLHIHHLATGKWLLPGGHLEDADGTLLEAALRELAEETGVPADVVTPLGTDPVHIDLHPIPANDAKAEPDHQHVDFRFLFRTDAEVGPLQTEEVADSAWQTVDTLHDERLRQRVAKALASD